MKNVRLTEKHGLHEGDRVKLMYRGSFREEELDEDGNRMVSGTIYQIYELFVVIASRCGVKHCYFWQDFLKWRI